VQKKAKYSEADDDVAQKERAMAAPEAPIVDRVRRAIEPIEEVRVAYLFGSQIRGKPRADSDLDLAISLAPESDDDFRERTRRRVVAALTDALGAIGERADVLDLGRAGAEVAFAAIRDGVCVLARSREERVRLEARIARRYDEEAPRRALFLEAARRAAARMALTGHGRS
jgi:predicted nucleotidyltransferase